jgi:hypothetical protein
MRQAMRAAPPKYLKAYETEKGALAEVRAYAYARACNGLPPLRVEELDGKWWTVNPDPDAPARPYKKPGA